MAIAHGTRQGQARLYSMRELNQRTAEVMKEINESGEPAAVTRHGRFVALILPLADVDVESITLSALVDAVENKRQLTGEHTVAGYKELDELAGELGVNLHE